MLKKSIYFLFHPAVLGFIIFVIIILLAPPIFDKYQAEVIEIKKNRRPDVYSYYDLDFDGFSEEIWYHGPPNSYPTFIIKTKGKIIDQWNFEGDFLGSDFFIYDDYDKDSLNEIFILTVKGDSIFLTGVSPRKKNEPYFVKLFIDKCGSYNGVSTCSVNFCDISDEDKDGYNELVFALNTGMQKQPRNLYKVNIFNKTVSKSPESGTAINNPVAFDINNDGYKEYFGKSSAYGNFHSDSIDYPDNHAWLMVLDRNMNFLFESPKFGQYKTTLDFKPLQSFGTNYIAGLQLQHGPENISNKLILFDPYGNKIREWVLENNDGIEKSFLLSRDKINHDELLLFQSNGQIVQLDTNLNFIKSYQLPDILIAVPTSIDIDLDGKDEFIFMSTDMQNLIITRNDFSFPVKVEFDNNMNTPRYFSIIKNGAAKPNLYFQIDGQSFIIEYSKNTLYPFKYLIWIGLYLIFFGFLFLLQKIQNIRARKKFELIKQIAELQLKSIKGQTDPHFTLNLIDSIGNLFYKKDSEKAGYVFGKYAKLLRTTILSADNISVSLEDELDYVKNYMDLEKFRYDDNFNYKIEISNNLNTQIKIPKMIIHTFVENAIKHGLKHKEGHGEIDIIINQKAKAIEVRIKDNGIGRQKAKQYSKLSTGKGLQILDKMLDLYFNLEKTKIIYHFTDLISDDEVSEGTLVIIKIPA